MKSAMVPNRLLTQAQDASTLQSNVVIHPDGSVPFTCLVRKGYFLNSKRENFYIKKLQKEFSNSQMFAL